MPAAAGNNSKCNSSFKSQSVVAKNRRRFSRNSASKSFSLSTWTKTVVWRFILVWCVTILFVPNFLLVPLAVSTTTVPKMRPIVDNVLSSTRPAQSPTKKLSVYNNDSFTSEMDEFLSTKIIPTTTNASTTTTTKRKQRAETAIRRKNLLHLKQLQTSSSTSSRVGNSNMLINFNQMNSTNPCYNFTVGYSTRNTHSTQTTTPGQYQSVVLTTPNYPYTYPNSTSCVRLLEAPLGHVVRLAFDGPMRLEGKCRTSTSGIGGSSGSENQFVSAASPSAYARAFLATALAASSSPSSTPTTNGEADGCDCYDYIEVRDGRFGYSPAIAHFCGTFNDPQFLPNIYSTGRHLWLHFTSDGSVQYDGVKLRADFLPEIDVNNGFTTLAPPLNDSGDQVGTVNGQQTVNGGGECVIYADIANDGYISTAQVPQAHRARTREIVGVPLDCSWIIRAPTAQHNLLLQFVSYELLAPNACNINYVDVYEDGTTRARDRLFQFCGSDSQVLRCDAPIAVVRLYAATTLAANRTRFKMLYTAFQHKLNEDDENECRDKRNSSFDCGDGTCINSTLLCNGNNNCLSRDDEKDCDVNELAVMPTDTGSKPAAGVIGPPWPIASIRSIVISIAAALTMITLLICALIWTCCIRHRQKRRRKELAEATQATTAALASTVAARSEPKPNEDLVLMGMAQLPVTKSTVSQQNGRVLMRDEKETSTQRITDHLLRDQPSLPHHHPGQQQFEYDDENDDEDQYGRNINNRNLVAYTIATRGSAASAASRHGLDDNNRPQQSSSYQYQQQQSMTMDRESAPHNNPSLPPLPQGYYYYYHSQPPRQDPQQNNTANWIQQQQQQQQQEPPSTYRVVSNRRPLATGPAQQQQQQHYVGFAPENTYSVSSRAAHNIPRSQMCYQQQQNPPYYYYYYDSTAAAGNINNDDFSDTTASDIGGAIAAATVADHQFQQPSSSIATPVQVLVASNSSKSVRFDPAPTAIVEYEAENYDDEDDGQRANAPAGIDYNQQQNTAAASSAPDGVKYYYYLTADGPPVAAGSSQPAYHQQPYSININSTPPLLSPPSRESEDDDDNDEFADEDDSLATLPINRRRKRQGVSLSSSAAQAARQGSSAPGVTSENTAIYLAGARGEPAPSAV